MSDRVRVRTACAVVAVVVVAVVAVALATPTTPTPSGPPSTGQPTLPSRHPRKYDPAPLDVIANRSNLVGINDRRAIVLTRTQIQLVLGATVLRSVPFRATAPVSFSAVVGAIHAPVWARETSPGVFLLRAAFAQAPGTSVSFAPPHVSVLRLSNMPNVFVGGYGARAEFHDVTVTSWDERTHTVVAEPGSGRPFLDYEHDSVFNVDGSRMSYLGYDRSTAYGLSWRDGATGSMTGSEASHNFFGAYTGEAHGVTFRNNVFRDNVFYGLDPHTGSRDLVVEGNEAFGNGAHGIVFSKGVVRSVVRGNYCHNNGGDGIVMDLRSGDNLIQGNRVDDNAGDGIVILGSSDVRIIGNSIQGNRDGIRVNHESLHTVISGNTIQHNDTGIELYDGAFETTTTRNQILNSAGIGYIVEDAGIVSRSDVIDGATIGMDVRAPARVEGTVIRSAGVGVRVSSTGIASLRDLNVRAERIGVEIQSGGIARLTNSDVTAPKPWFGVFRLDAGNDLTQPLNLLPWLGILGLVFLAAAIALQVLHRLRNGRQHYVVTQVPAGVSNVR